MNAKKAVKPEPLNAGTAKLPEAIFALGGETVDRTIKSYTKSVAGWRDQFETALVKGTRALGLDLLADLGKANLDAVYTSGEAVTRGAETLGRNFWEFTRRSAERNIRASENLVRSKSVQEAAEVQLNYCKECLDVFLAEGAEIVEIATRSTEEAVAPLTDRAQATYSRFFNTSSS